jgi:thiol-disulfide isomerase/thioredoxin
VNTPFDLGAIPLHIRPRLRVGKTVPEIMGPGRDGKTVQLSSFRGKPVLLHFWGTSIGYSTSEFQALRELQRSHGEPGQLVIVSCNLDPASYNPGDFAGREGFTWPQIFLGSWQNTPVPGWFGLNGSSGAVLIDAEGRLASSLLRGSNLRSSVLSAVEE